MAEFPGALRLGLRRRRPVRALPRLRPARRLPPLRRPGPPAGPGRDPRRRLQPLRPRRQLPRAASRRTTSPTRQTEWGAGHQLRRRRTPPAPATLVVDNAAYWIDEFHLDGLRLDATQSIFDDSPDHLVAALTRAARAAAGRRAIDPGGRRERAAGDAGWCARPRRAATASTPSGTTTCTTRAVVALTGRTEAYYTDYTGHRRRSCSRPSSTATSSRASATTGRSSGAGSSARGLAARAFAAFLENHDQVANSATGAAAVAADQPRPPPGPDHPAAAAALDAVAVPGAGVERRRPVLLLRRPQRRSWPRLVRKGRAEFLAQFPSCATPEAAGRAGRSRRRPRTFERCRLDWDEREPARARPGAGPAPGSAGAAPAGPGARAPRASDGGDPRRRGAGAGVPSWCATWRATRGDDRLLLVNLGRDLRAAARRPSRCWPPPRAARWQLLWSSDDRRYGGPGACPPESEDEGWTIPGAGGRACWAAVPDIEDHGNH